MVYVVKPTVKPVWCFSAWLLRLYLLNSFPKGKEYTSSKLKWSIKEEFIVVIFQRIEDRLLILTNVLAVYLICFYFQETFFINFIYILYYGSSLLNFFQRPFEYKGIVVFCLKQIIWFS